MPYVAPMDLDFSNEIARAFEQRRLKKQQQLQNAMLYAELGQTKAANELLRRGGFPEMEALPEQDDLEVQKFKLDVFSTAVDLAERDPKAAKQLLSRFGFGTLDFVPAKEGEPQRMRYTPKKGSPLYGLKFEGPSEGVKAVTSALAQNPQLANDPQKFVTLLAQHGVSSELVSKKGEGAGGGRGIAAVDLKRVADAVKPFFQADEFGNIRPEHVKEYAMAVQLAGELFLSGVPLTDAITQALFEIRKGRGLDAVPEYSKGAVFDNINKATSYLSDLATRVPVDYNKAQAALKAKGFPEDRIPEILERAGIWRKKTKAKPARPNVTGTKPAETQKAGPKPTKTFNSPEEVREAMLREEISRAEAVEILRRNFEMQ